MALGKKKSKKTARKTARKNNNKRDKAHKDKAYYKNFKKRGIAIGQVFVYITAAITFALIMIFGYKAVQDFLQSGEQVAFVQFKTSLESSIKKIYTEYGSVRVERFTLPAEFSQICFVDMDAEYNKALCQYDQVACSVWEDASSLTGPDNEKGGYDAVDENIFLQPVVPNIPKIKSYKISVSKEYGSKKGEEGFICIPVKKGVFSVVMEGKGDRTELSLKEGFAEN